MAWVRVSKSGAHYALGKCQRTGKGWFYCEASKDTIGFVVDTSSPFRERAFDGAQVFQIKRLYTAHGRRPVSADFRAMRSPGARYKAILAFSDRAVFPEAIP